MRSISSSIAPIVVTPAVRTVGLSLLMCIFGTLAACSDQKPAASPFTASVKTPTEDARPVLLTGGIVVDTRTGDLAEGMDVLLEDGKIAGIGASGTLVPAVDPQRVEISGKFIVPGFLEMHAHSMQSEDPATDMALMLAKGITGFRQMMGTPELLAQREAGAILSPTQAPELLIMPGPILIRQNTSTPEKAAAEVQRQKAMGVDFIKMVDTPRVEYLAALDEAHRLGLPFAGHLPSSISVIEAAEHGMTAIEHLGPTSSIMLSCSSDETALRQAIEEAGPQGPPVLPDFVFNIAEPLLIRMFSKMAVNPMLKASDESFALMQRLVETYDQEKCAQLAQTLAATAMWQVPTLIRVRAMEFGDDPDFRNDPNLIYVPAKKVELWQSVADEFTEAMPAARRETLQQFYETQLELFRLFDKAGVKMLTGSDLGGQWLIPGFSLHQEFDILAGAGASPLKVLQMATLNGAKFLGREASMGTVEEGKDANLVILDANPIASVQALHEIYAVVRNGTVLLPDRLLEMQEAAKGR